MWEICLAHIAAKKNMSYLKPSEISQIYRFTLAATKGFHRGDFDKITKLLHLLSGILVQFL